MIYFVQRADGAIKIGFSDNFQFRFRQLESKNGRLELLGLMDGDLTTESEMHSRFQHLHFDKKEWFRDSQDLRQFIAVNTHMRIPDQTTTYVQVDTRVNEALKVLKELTGARSMSEVIEQILTEHQPEAIKAADERMQMIRALKERQSQS